MIFQTEFFIMYIIAVAQIGTMMFAISLLVKEKSEIMRKEKENLSTYYIFILISLGIAAIYIVIALSPIKVNIDQNNDCIAFYKYFPDYSGNPGNYTFSWEKICEKTYSKEQINTIKNAGRYEIRNQDLNFSNFGGNYG